MIKEYTRVTGEAEGLQYSCIVEGNNKEVLQELRECMGIVAYSHIEFIRELQEIGFLVIEDLEALNIKEDQIQSVTIPINLLDNEDLF